jgi:hypothetical protein
VYVREIQGEVLDFGHRGWLLDESFIFYDKTYDSLWVQATGQCIAGKFRGERLQAIPVTHTTWAAWSSLYADTLVLAKPSHRIGQYLHDSYEPAYRQWGTQFGLAVFAGDGAKLYPLEELRGVPVVQDAIGGQAVLIVYHEPSGTALAFDSTIAGQLIEFEHVETTEHDVMIRDRSSGGTWSGLSGRARAPRGAGPQLQQLRTSQFVVSKWHKHFPGAAVFGTP